MTDGPLAPWLADIAANVLAVVLVVLVVIGLTPRGVAPAQRLPLVAVVPEGPAQVVALLRERLRGQHTAIDLTEQGIRLAREGGGPVLVSVFSPRDHGRLVADLAAQPQAWREITVPEALHAADGSGYSAAFQALRDQAEDPDEFRRALGRLLSGPSQGRARSAIGDSPASGEGGLAARMSDWGRILSALAALAVVLALRALGRRAEAKVAGAGANRGGQA